MALRRNTIIVLLSMGLLAVAAMAAEPTYLLYRTWSLQRRMHGAEEKAVRSVLAKLAQLETPRADRVVLRALAAEQPDRRRSAAYAIFRARREDLAAVLREAWSAETSGLVRCSMIYFWGQLSGDQAVLRDLLIHDDPWTRLGAVKGLLRLGQLDIEPVIFEFARSDDNDLQRDAQLELQSLAVPMAELIGQPDEVLRAYAGTWTPGEWQSIRAWWGRHVTSRLLRDYVKWRYDKPSYWKRARLLQHEWDKNASGFLRMSEPNSVNEMDSD